MHKLTWEEIEQYMHRIKVPGGWLVRQSDRRWDAGDERYYDSVVSTCFVPDPDDTWYLGDLVIGDQVTVRGGGHYVITELHIDYAVCNAMITLAPIRVPLKDIAKVT